MTAQTRWMLVGVMAGLWAATVVIAFTILCEMAAGS